MTKIHRTILFLILSLLFLLIAPCIVLYSQGYRLDFNLYEKQINIVKTGGLFLKILPQETEIYINGQLKGKTNFLFNSVLIDNLLPKTYKIEVKKNKYNSWEKELEVNSQQVTEVKNIVLIPKDINFSILDYNSDYAPIFNKNIEDFFLSPDGKKIILKIKAKKDWSLWFFNLENSQSFLIINIEKKDIEAESPVLNSLDWSSDSRRILVKTTTDKGLEYFVAEFVPEFRLVSLDFLAQNSENIFLNPIDSSKIFFTKGDETKNIYQADLSKTTVDSKPIFKGVISYAVAGDNLILLTEQGFFYKANFSGKIIEALINEPFEIKNEARRRIFNFGNKTFFQESDRLFFLDKDSKSLKKVSDSIADFKVSPDLKKIVYYDNYEIQIFHLESQNDQPQKKICEKTFLTRYTEKIDQLFWLTCHYLIFNTGEKIKIAEIDDRNKINIIDLPSLEHLNNNIVINENSEENQNQKMFWDLNDKILYILKNGTLFTTEDILPH